MKKVDYYQLGNKTSTTSTLFTDAVANGVQEFYLHTNANWDADTEIYFEAFGWQVDIRLTDTSNNTIVAFTNVGFTPVKSANIRSLLANNTTYKVRIKVTSTKTSASLYGARLIMSKNAPTVSETYIQMSDYPTAALGLSAYGLPFTYNAEQWDGISSIKFSASLKPSSLTGTKNLQLYDVTAGAVVCTLTPNTLALALYSATATLTDGHTYQIYANASSGTLYSAYPKIIIKQSSFTKYVKRVPLNTASLGVAGGSYQYDQTIDFPFLYDHNDFRNTIIGDIYFRGSFAKASTTNPFIAIGSAAIQSDIIAVSELTTSLGTVVSLSAGFSESDISSGATYVLKLKDAQIYSACLDFVISANAVSGFLVSDAGDVSYNGIYQAAGTHNGQTYYINSNGRYLFYNHYVGPEPGGNIWVLNDILNDLDFPGMQVAYYCGSGDITGEWDTIDYYGTKEPPPSVDYYAGGNVSDDIARSCVIKGSIGSDSKSVSARLWGVNATQSDRSCYLYAVEGGVAIRSCYIRGMGTGADGTVDRSEVIFGILQSHTDQNLFLNGRPPGVEDYANRSLLIHGYDNDDIDRSLYIDGTKGTDEFQDRSCYVQGQETNITDFIKPSRPGKIKFGVNNELVQIFDGYSQIPKSNQRDKTTAIHFYDNMEFLRNYKLPEGSLNIDINSADYIRAILLEAGIALADMILDVGIQRLPVAWYGGNTALYEIEQTVEAEGGRFYVREDGKFIFENRQHYNLNDSYKQMSWLFDFNNMTDLDYPRDQSSIVNKVTIEVEPRLQQTESDIWTFGEMPNLLPGESVTLWAKFTDPVSPIVTPEVNTDYTANTQKDGAGVDKSSDILITITKFAQAAKLVIKNTGTFSIFLTKLKVRGQAYLKQDKVTITADDLASQALYGVIELALTNKYFQDSSYAQTLANTMVLRYSTPLHRIVLKNRCVPHLQLGDMVSVKNNEIDKTYLMRIVRILSNFSSDGMDQEITVRGITDDELADYFTIGTSVIGGNDVIAP